VRQGTFETTVEVDGEFLVRRRRGRGQRADDQVTPRGESVQPLAAQVPKAALDEVPDDGSADGPADHEPHPGWVVGSAEQEMHDEGLAAAAAAGTRDVAQVVTSDEAMLRREHGREGTRPNEGRSSRGSDREALAALATARRQDRASRAGAHAQPEPVRLVTAAVVRLVRTLAHDFFSDGQGRSRRRFGQIARWLGRGWSKPRGGLRFRPAPPAHALPPPSTAQRHRGDPGGT
jgi:hypothetical protein